MSAIPAVIFHLEEAAHDVGCDGQREYAGWIFGREPTHCCAVRACGGGPTVHGILGLPRIDVAAAYPSDPQAAVSGFRITMRHGDRRSVRLEWMDRAGLWREFWREPTGEKVGRSSRYRPRLPDNLWPALRTITDKETAGLSWRETWRRTRELVQDFTSEITPPTDCPGQFVNLDQPHGALFSERVVPLSGWIFNRRSPVRRLFAEMEPAGLIHVIFPKPRPDVAAAYPTPPASIRCGFEGMILLPAKPPAWFNLRLYAESADGSVSLALSRQFFRQSISDERSLHLRASVVLGTFALSGAFRPDSWLRWLRKICPLRQIATPSPGLPTARRVVEKTHRAIPESDPASWVEPLAGDPLISILVPVYNTPERYLREMIASVQAQSYPRWELCLADDASTEPHVRRVLVEFARSDARIRPIYRAENGHISRASNSALAHATGEFIALLDHDDLLAPDVLLRVVETIRTQPAARFVYTNRDKIDDSGRHFDAENRGDWNPAAAITHNYLHHLTVIQRDLVLQAGAFRPEYFGSQDLDLYLRCHELLQPDQIVHVPMVGYHWRAHSGSTASRGDQKDYMFDSARRGIEDALRRRGLRATPFLPDFGAIYGMNLHQLHWDPGILRETGASIIVAVPAERRGRWQQCLAELRATVPTDQAQLVVVSAGVIATALSRAMRGDGTYIAASPETPLAELYNIGATHARHPLLLLLDVGAVSTQGGWLEDLAGWLSIPGVAAAGPKLIAADGCLASAAGTISPKTHLPELLCAGDPVNEIKAPYLSLSARDALLLDPICVLTRTKVFRELGGYDSRHFPIRHFAADYCLRLKATGRRAVFSPQAVLHADQSLEIEPRTPCTAENDAFQKKHPHCVDPWIRPATPNQPDTWMPAATIEFSGGWFFLEQPFPGEEIHAGHQILTGWCLPRTGKTIAELRVRCEGNSYPVDLGHPRPDLAANTGFAGDFLPAGFSVELALPSGRFRLEFEAYIVGPGWREVCSVKLDVLPMPASSRPGLPAPITLAHCADAQELLLKQAAANPTVRLTRHAVTFASDTAILTCRRYPAKPFHGFINHPAPNVVPMYGGIIVAGWLVHETQPILRVAASYDLTSWIELQHMRDSPEVGERFPRLPSAARCGIFGFVNVPQDMPQPLALRIWAELAEGGWRLVFTLRGRMHSLGAADLRLLLGVSTWTLCRTAWAVQRALLRRQGSISGCPGFGTVLKEMRRRLPVPARSHKNPAGSFSPVTPDLPSAPHLLLVSHNLNREGAPMFLLELARYCRRHAATGLTVVSPFDGSLRAEFEQLGAEVRIVDRTPLWSAENPGGVEGALDALSYDLDAHAASLVIANTIECFWAVSIAQRAGRPALFYIHEPGVPGFHYLDHPVRHLWHAAANALATATCVSFTNRATQAYYLAYSSGANYRIQPGWTDQFSSAVLPTRTSRERLRARLGFAPAERVVINVGTVCQRKGQLFFVYAAEHLWRTQPALAASCRFLLIGANDNAYGASVTALIARLGRPNLELVPPTKEVQHYFSAADLFVLSSFEEGFSRVLLEAMGFGLPIVSTAIHGIPEIARHEKEGLLVPAGDIPAMAGAMQLLLENEVMAARLGRNAQERLANTYAATRVLPGHLATIKELAPDLKPSVPKIPAPGFREPICAAS